MSDRTQSVIAVAALIVACVFAVLKEHEVKQYKRSSQEWEQASARAVSAAKAAQNLAEEWKSEAMHCVDMWDRHQEHR